MSSSGLGAFKRSCYASGGVLVLGVPFRSRTMRTKEKAPPRTGPSASLQLKFWSAEGAAFLPSGKTISGRGETFPPSRNKLRRPMTGPINDYGDMPWVVPV